MPKVYSVPVYFINSSSRRKTKDSQSGDLIEIIYLLKRSKKIALDVVKDRAEKVSVNKTGKVLANSFSG